MLSCLYLVHSSGSNSTKLNFLGYRYRWRNTRRRTQDKALPMASISTCSLCSRIENSWLPVYDGCEAETISYVCVRCRDRKRRQAIAERFVKLHCNKFQVDVFTYLHPANYQQWIYLNRHLRNQRMDNLRYLLNGSPYTPNIFYDTHFLMKEQVKRGCTRGGRLYRTRFWIDELDLLDHICSFLI